MVGAVLFALVMLVGVPVGVMVGGAVWSALFGQVAADDAQRRADAAPTD